jgi:hypothetical protein
MGQTKGHGAGGFGSHPLYAVVAHTAGKVGHAGGRQMLVFGWPAKQLHSHQPPAYSGIVQNARPSPIVHRVEEEVDRKVERDRGQALG